MKRPPSRFLQPSLFPVEGPLPAIDDFLARHPDFAVDKSRERYLMTYSPRGFLRRAG